MLLMAKKIKESKSLSSWPVYAGIGIAAVLIGIAMLASSGVFNFSSSDIVGKAIGEVCQCTQTFQGCSGNYLECCDTVRDCQINAFDCEYRECTENSGKCGAMLKQKEAIKQRYSSCSSSCS